MRDKPAETTKGTDGLPSLPFRVTAIAGRTQTHVVFAPDAAARQVIAAALDLLSLPEFRMEGDIRPSGKRDLELRATMQAVVVQPCAITLAPVTTKLGEPVRRRYLADFEPPKGEEAELTEDEADEPLPEVIDAAAIAIEALALALPMYPRARNAELGEAVFTAPGAAPLKDGDLKPFAGLAGLVARAADKGGSDPV